MTDRRDTPSASVNDLSFADARDLVIALRKHAERVECDLDYAGYREAAREVYDLRLRMSEILRRLA